MQNIKAVKRIAFIWLHCHIVLLKSLRSFRWFFLILSITISLIIQPHTWSFSSRYIHVYLSYIKPIHGTLDPPALAMYSLRSSLDVIIEQEAHRP